MTAVTACLFNSQAEINQTGPPILLCLYKNIKFNKKDPARRNFCRQDLSVKNQK
jgi:hypothetical protein